MHYQYVPSPKLYRSSHDRVIWGVCGGIAEYFSVSSFWVRIGAIVLLFTFLPAAILGYILARLIMPRRVMPAVPQVNDLPPIPEAPPQPAVSISALKSKFDDIEQQICRMEDIVTSKEFVLRREFESLAR